MRFTASSIRSDQFNHRKKQKQQQGKSLYNIVANILFKFDIVVASCRKNLSL